MQLIVLKSDGSTEIYLHTKVMGTIASALGECDCFETGLSEHLSEAVTSFLLRRYGACSVTSCEIHSMIEAVLSDTGFDQAALALHEHRILRQMKRDRIDVLRLQPLADKHATEYAQSEMTILDSQPWNKSIIIETLETQYDFEPYTARSIAASVEEKVLQLNCRNLTTALVRELVIHEVFIMRQAQQALAKQTVDLGAEEEAVTAGKQAVTAVPCAPRALMATD